MTPNPILKVLSTLSTHQVQYLLMGGQACVFYGGAEFSRDCDVALLANQENVDRLADALGALQAVRIAVPPFELRYLERGHAVHFRCSHAEAANMRLDVMSRMRGVAPFAELWQRRVTLQSKAESPEQLGLPVVQIELMGLEDLVRAKRTQRDKDWPMIRRLVESHYATHLQDPTEAQKQLWLGHSRTPEMLIDLVSREPELASQVAAQRPLVSLARDANPDALQQALDQEAARECQADRLYWAPLKAELEQLRFQKRKR